MDELIGIGVIHRSGNGNSEVLEFSSDFRDDVFEQTATQTKSIECSGSQCEARSIIRQSIGRLLREKISDKNTIDVCAELFLLEHGKTSHELN